MTDSQLRARWRGEKTLTVPQDTVITPAAMDFLRENNISLSRRSEGMTVEENPGGRYVEAATGRPMAEKTEDMTHLRGNLLVPKTHPRIAFRGKLDSVMADTLLAQCLAREKGCAMAEDGLGEVLQALLQGVEVYLCEEALPHRAYAGKGSKVLYAVLEGYANTLQTYGVRPACLWEPKPEIPAKPPKFQAPAMPAIKGSACPNCAMVITEEGARALGSGGDSSGTIPQGAIVTPSAWDVLRASGAEIIKE